MLAVLGAAPRVAPRVSTGYTLRDLGTLPGDTTSAASAISDTQAVVGWSVNAEGMAHAFLWDRGVMTALGDLGGGTSIAWDINNARQVVGWSANASHVVHAFLWDNGVMTDLGPGIAYGVNDAGQAVGASQGDPVLWDEHGMTDLGRPNATASWPVQKAVAINDASQVLVRSEGGDPNGIGVRTFLWRAGSWTELPADGPRTIGSDVNDAGQVAGWSAGFSRYTSAWMQDRGAFAPLRSLGGHQPEALALNDAGEAVGYDQVQGGAYGTSTAVLWQNGTATDLGALVEGKPSMALDINRARNIVGWSWASSRESQHAVLWQITAG